MNGNVTIHSYLARRSMYEGWCSIINISELVKIRNKIEGKEKTELNKGGEM